MGQLPIQVDYSDYRELAGVKMPYKLILTWLDGRSTVVLNDLRANVPIEASGFARPEQSSPELPPK